jgi:hypothetical protein
MPTHGSGTNEIVPFANGVGANVEDPADWDANVVRQQGFQNGVALPNLANTVWRQASVIASMIAQFSADYSGEASVDDGDVIAAEDRFVAALNQFVAPTGVYVVNDTGTANAVVGTSSPAPASYSDVRIVIFKKMNADNSGNMTINLWDLGVVPLTDNTGANLASGALKANSYYIATRDGSGFRILGGATTYTNVANLTANSGDGIEVTVGGVVNRRRASGTHNTTVNANDRWARGKSTDDTDLYMTTSELLAYLQANLSFLTSAPTQGFGTAVGQCCVSLITTSGWVINLAYAGITAGMTISGANLSAGAIPGANSWFTGMSAPNGVNSGAVGSIYDPGAEVYGNSGVALTGTWRLVASTFVISMANNTEWHLAFWQRIA